MRLGALLRGAGRAAGLPLRYPVAAIAIVVATYAFGPGLYLSALFIWESKSHPLLTCSVEPPSISVGVNGRQASAVLSICVGFPASSQWEIKVRGLGQERPQTVAYFGSVLGPPKFTWTAPDRLTVSVKGAEEWHGLQSQAGDVKVRFDIDQSIF